MEDLSLPVPDFQLINQVIEAQIRETTRTPGKKSD